MLRAPVILLSEIKKNKIAMMKSNKKMLALKNVGPGRAEIWDLVYCGLNIKYNIFQYTLCA